MQWNSYAWERARTLIQELSMTTGDFTLSGGGKSDVHFEMGKSILHPECGSLISHLVVDWLIAHHVRCIGGLEMGAVPLVSVVSAAAQIRGWPLSVFYVRKASKTHGKQQKFDGHIDPDSRIAAVDDVATTGGSISKAQPHAFIAPDKVGLTKNIALVVLDREEGATENLKKQNIYLDSIYKKSDFILSEQ